MRTIWCFDLWGTLIESCSDTPSYEDLLMAYGVPRERIFPFVRDHCMTEKISYEEIAKRLLDYFGIKDQMLAIKIVEAFAISNEQVRWMPKSEATLKEIRKLGHSTVLITNSTYPGWKSANEVLQIEQYFDRLYLSWEQGFSKPVTSVFLRVQDWFPDSRNRHLVMVGDSYESDIATPKELGWQTIQVKGGIQDVLDAKSKRPTV